jgi:uncharacterized protein
MNKLLSSDKIYIAPSKIPGAGRGVFARVSVKKGELIEKCPVIEIPEHETSEITEGILITYLYYFGKNKERSAIALGFGSIYNHLDKPNAMYKENYKEQTIDFVALRNIQKEEEITVNYNQGNQKDSSPLWFKEL